MEEEKKKLKFVCGVRKIFDLVQSYLSEKEDFTYNRSGAGMEYLFGTVGPWYP